MIIDDKLHITLPPPLPVSVMPLTKDVGWEQIVPYFIFSA